MAKGKEAVAAAETGEDHIAAFDNQVEKLVGLALAAEFESGSLLGDVRDVLLDTFKHRPKAWSQLSEAEQRDLGKALENVAKTLIRKVVVVVAEEDIFSVSGVLKGYSGKGGTFKLTVEARGDEETARELFNMDGHDVVIMSADAGRFLGKNGEAEVQPDQPALGFSDAEQEQETAEEESAGEPAEEAESEGEEEAAPLQAADA